MITFNKKHPNNRVILEELKNRIVEKKSEIVDVITVVIGSMSIMGICLILLLTLTQKANDVDIIISSAFSLLLGFIVFPICLLKKHYQFNLYEIGIKKIKIDFFLILKIIIAIIVFILISKKYDNDEVLKLAILQNVSVSVAEEFLYRGVITYLLEKIVNKHIFVYIISGLIFIFVLHSGATFLENIIYRLPITILLCIVYYKSKDLTDTILIHWLYNIFASSLV